MIKKAKEGITSAYSNEEHALMQAINAYLETNKSYNLVFERLSEWYGIYFPEIKIANPKTLADLAIVLNSRDGISKESISAIVEDTQKADSIYNKAKATIGREMSGKEREAMLHFARLSNQVHDTLLGLEVYIKATSTEIMPNTTYLTDEKIAAELLSKAGSLERLATMPASTVQLLGAEKALFKHIKFGSNPPKYGTLFKLAEISNGPRDRRGRIARVYAAKLSIALKADYFSKKFIAEKLKEDLDKAVKRIKDAPAREPMRRTPNQFSKPSFQGQRQNRPNNPSRRSFGNNKFSKNPNQRNGGNNRFKR